MLLHTSVQGRKKKIVSNACNIYLTLLLFKGRGKHDTKNEEVFSVYLSKEIALTLEEGGNTESHASLFEF